MKFFLFIIFFYPLAGLAQELNLQVKNVSEYTMENLVIFGDTIDTLKPSEVRNINGFSAITFFGGNLHYSISCTINGVEKNGNNLPPKDRPICGTGTRTITEGNYLIKVGFEEDRTWLNELSELVIKEFKEIN